MYAALRNYVDQWLFQLRGPQTGPIVLAQRRIFILPTRQGLIFAAVLLLMLVGSINYGLSLGFVLTFLLAGLSFNAMVYTFRNLANLQVSAARTEPVFAGEVAHFRICVDNAGPLERFAIGLGRKDEECSYIDVRAHETALAAIGIRAERRGLLRPGRLILFTRYPLGLFYAWSYLELDMACLVYPRPATAALSLPAPESGTGNGTPSGQGREDFAGLRQYHAGDSPRHIAWKAAARGQGLLTKQFSGRAETELWLDWSALPPRMGVEEKLSHLARWVLEAHARGIAFGLRLPARTVALGSGDAQRERCLEALALFDHDNEAQPA